MKSLFSRKVSYSPTPEEAFWAWFVSHEDKLLELDPGKSETRKSVFTQVGVELHKIDPNLTFEFGHGMEPRDFVISAGGIRESFGAVIRLRDAAPKLPRWNVIAFRPRRGEHGVIKMAGITIDSRDVTFNLLDDGKTAGLRLFLPDYSEDNSTIKSIAYLFLDQALGEYDVETGLTFLKFHAPEDDTEGERHPLTELTVLFDQLMVQLGRSAAEIN